MFDCIYNNVKNLMCVGFVGIGILFGLFIVEKYDAIKESLHL